MNEMKMERPLMNGQWDEEGEDVDEDENDEKEEDKTRPLDIHRNSLMHRTEMGNGLREKRIR